MGGHKKNESRRKNRPRDQSDGTPLTDLLNLKYSDSIGRYLVARSDITPGSVILKEFPLVVGPKHSGLPKCLSCYKEIPDIISCVRCQKCDWPLCSESCQGIFKNYGHTKEECLLLSKCKHKPKQQEDYDMYNIITTLRILILEESKSKKWEEISAMEAHNEKRKENSSLWDTNQKYIVDCIREKCGFEEHTEDEIHTICGYIQINSFDVESVGLIALYPKAYLFIHDCIPNTTHIIDRDFMMSVRTTVPIKKGDLIKLSYANTLSGTIPRRKQLKESKYFDCDCKRCRDPTELDTYLSAVKCKSCPNGYLLPENPINSDSKWICRGNCNRSETAADISNLIKRYCQRKQKTDGKHLKHVSKEKQWN